MFLFALLLGSALGVRQADAEEDAMAFPARPQRRVAALAIACVAWLATAGTLAVPALLAEEHADAGDEHLRTGSPPRAAQSYHAAFETIPYNADYALRVDGPWDPDQGHRFNRNKVLIDPYAKGNTNNLWDRGASCGPGDNITKSLRSVVIDETDYDWEGDEPLRRPMSETVIYEMHVGGFTRHPELT
jgi:glycogen operon protein